MNEFTAEIFVNSADGKLSKLESLDEKILMKWKKDLELRALSEYYNKKVKSSDAEI